MLFQPRQAEKHFMSYCFIYSNLFVIYPVAVQSTITARHFQGFLPTLQCGVNYLI